MSGATPTRVDQIIPSIVEHDAVSNHAFNVQRLLQEMGYLSTIYALVLGPGVEGRVRPLGEFRSEGGTGHWVIYQSSIGSPAAEVFAQHSGIKLLDYHNITPAEFVERWIPPLGEETRLGRTQLAKLAPIVDFAIADSAYNASELRDCGYRYAEVVPVLVAAGAITDKPDAATIDRFDSQPGHDWLFVGQLAPHKAQHEIIMAFARYRALYDHNARLHLVGREMGSAYREALRRFIEKIGLGDSITLTGSVTTSELAAYYELCDVFVCLSNHEGFCAPIAEAMARGLPVVAYGAAAVPDTVGDAGIVLSQKDPDFVASVVHELFMKPELIEALKSRGRIRAATFTLESAEEAFRSAFAMATSLLA